MEPGVTCCNETTAEHSVQAIQPVLLKTEPNVMLIRAGTHEELVLANVSMQHVELGIVGCKSI